MKINLDGITFHETNDIIESKKKLRWPRVEPGSTASNGAMLTAIPPTLVRQSLLFQNKVINLPGTS